MSIPMQTPRTAETLPVQYYDLCRNILKVSESFEVRPAQGGSMPTPGLGAPMLTPGMEIIAYRLSMVENEVSGVDKKLDKFVDKFDDRFDSLQQVIADNYISNKTLEYVLNPFQSRLKEVEAYISDKEKNEAADRRQIRLMMIGALISPIAAIFVAAIIAAITVGLSK